MDRRTDKAFASSLMMGGVEVVLGGPPLTRGIPFKRPKDVERLSKYGKLFSSLSVFPHFQRLEKLTFSTDFATEALNFERGSIHCADHFYPRVIRAGLSVEISPFFRTLVF